MAISQKHRASIFLKLSPTLGEEETEALLSHFPARDLDEPVTKEFVQVEIATVRTEIAELRTETRTGLAELRAEMSDRFRQQIMWLGSTNAVAIAVATAVARLLA